MQESPEHSRPPRWRLLVGFALLPPTQALLVYAAFPVLWIFLGNERFQPVNADQAARAMALLTGLFGVVVTICGAIPVVFWLIRTGRASCYAVVWAGAALGNAPFALYQLVFVLPATIRHVLLGTMSEHTLPVTDLVLGALRILAFGSALGMISGAVFWLIALSDRPVPRRAVG
jgi:hypothetical protein